MCLDTLEDFKVKLDKNGVGEGWKAFHIKGKKHLISVYFDRHFTHAFGYNKWIKSMPDKVHIRNGVFYTTGFHVFTKEKDAKRWSTAHGGDVVKKIKFKTILATGKDITAYKKTIVAEEIFIPKE